MTLCLKKEDFWMPALRFKQQEFEAFAQLGTLLVNIIGGISLILTVQTYSIAGNIGGH